jgi:hypothetical protein
MSGKNNNEKKVNEAKGKLTFFVPTRDYSKDPFVVKKVESIKKLIKKYGLPKELIND